MGLAWARQRREPDDGAERLARAAAEISGERRAGAVEQRLLGAALGATGCAAGEVARASGEVVARTGEPDPGAPALERELVAGGERLGRVRVWGGSPARDAAAALDVVAALGAHALRAAGLAASTRLAEDRARRVARAASEVAAAGGRSAAAAALLAQARALLDAPVAALLVRDAGGGIVVEMEDGVVADEPGAWAALGAEAVAAAEGGEVWTGEIESGCGTLPVALAGLACGRGRDGILALAGHPPLGPDGRALLGDLAARGSAAIWIASLEEELRELATIDPVTRLHDGRYFRQRLDQELSRAARAGTSVSLLVASFDGAAELRARGRDDLADDALLDLAVHLGHTLRSMDVACRIAGDEVGLIVPGAAGLEAVLVAERVRGSVAAVVSPSGRRTLSVGIATYPDQVVGREELITAARSALGWARDHGGDRAFLYDREVAELLEAQARSGAAGDDAFVATVYALAAAVDARDPSTHEHGRNVAHVAALLARELGLSPSHVEQVRTAGLLHDVGKIGVGDRILRKAGPLSEAEWDEMRQHPVVAGRILAGTRLEPIRPWVLHHHERMDGAGYPDGLAGEEIPLESRIIAVAEAFDALVQGRPYRPAVTPEAALREIAACAGTMFDPVVVAALRELAARGEPGVLPRPTP